MLLIKGATIQFPGTALHEKKRDILVKNGKIEAIRAKIDEPKARIIDANHAFVSPGWIDIGVQTGDPGFEHREDLQSVARAAAAGGFTGIATQPNTDPAIHSKSEVSYLLNSMKGALIDLFPLGALSADCAGKDITEMYDMAQAGAIAFTDGYQAVQNGGLMMRALQYVKAINGIIINPVYDESIAGEGQLHEGLMSTTLGMRGIPALSEELMLQRDLQLLEYTDSRLHVANISTAGSVALIREAKKKNPRLSASVAILNLVLTDEALATFDANYKVLPPLREKTDLQALVKGLQTGTIDFISSNHTPWEGERKNLEFPYAAFGVIGLETLFPVLNTFLKKELSVAKMVELLAIRPRQVFGIPVPEIKEKAAANLTIFDTSEKWTFTAKDIFSKSSNTPFVGQQFEGRVLGVINNGKTFFHPSA